MIQGALFNDSQVEPGSSGFARIAVELPIDGTFDYRIPPHLASQVKPGVRIWVSFSGRRVMGICIEVAERTEVHDPFDVLGVVDATPLLSERLLELVRWMAEYYHCPVGEAFAAALPSAARRGKGGRKVHAVRLLLEPAEALALSEELLSDKPKQARVLRLLAESEGWLTVAEICSKANVSRSPVQTLARHGKLDLFWKVVSGQVLPDRAEAFPKPERLSREQDEALGRIRDAIEQGGKADFLLYGVTGSGKTEIYLRTIEEMIARGRGAIVLVPEISLTPQTIHRFRGRFDKVAVLHSRLTDAERFQQWKLIQQGGADVVVGARSAVFAPMPNLGLIVVDEEHETSFKQQNMPQYHARDAVLKRAELEGAMVILGSATPSLESYQLAKKGLLRPLALRNRVGGRRFPTVSVVNMKYEKSPRNRFLSNALYTSLRDILARRQQAILFLNRRGYYPVLMCGACSETIRCEQCDITLTLHRKANRLICHYCGFERLPPDACPGCSQPKLRYIGVGTERVEDEVRTLFPEARLLRMDSDTMVGRNAHEKALGLFKSGEKDILIGTQMIAKGLDFPGVTLVGVISADTPLYQPDFRSSERAYQLLSQVSGRAGRGDDGGQVIVQTLNPEHFGIKCAVRNDYLTFAERELAIREETGYPPFAHLLRIVFSGEDIHEVERLALEMANALNRSLFDEGTKLLGPTRTPITMINGRYRWHMLIKSMKRDSLDLFADALKDAMRKQKRAFSKSVRMVLDMDPISML